MATRFVIIGGGPAGNTAATHAARLGAQVTLVERDVIGGAAHLWDCIPSKTMIATGGAIAFTRRLEGMGLEQQAPEVDVDALTERIESIKMRLQRSTTNLLTSQGVELVHGSAKMLSPNDVEITVRDSSGVATVRTITADAVEFVHMFSSFGARVNLVVSRQQVLPGKDPEVAAVLEDDFLQRGV